MLTRAAQSWFMQTRSPEQTLCPPSDGKCRFSCWLRRLSQRLGLERKLILCFMGVLSLAMAITFTLFTDQVHRQLGQIMGEQARQLAAALALTSRQAMVEQDWPGLHRMGQELVRGRNVLFVAWLDSQARARTLASRDVGLGLADLKLDTKNLMQTNRRHWPKFGEYVQVMAPVVSDLHESRITSSDAGPDRLLGYVAVGIGLSIEEKQLLGVKYLLIGVIWTVVLCAFPLACLLVYRIFLPIRKLVEVTRRIIAGDLDARVEIDRPDVIGELARSFDEMVGQVKRQRQALAQANRELEQRVQQRTAELAAANSRLSQEVAEKEEFLRAVSHDLNAPLRNINGMTSMLLLKCRQKLDEELVHRLERIKSNVELEMELIAELLELSRIKTRRQKMEPVDVQTLIEDLRNLFESDLRNGGIELIVDTPLPVLHAERARIRQVFQNLIDNAIKYMGQGATRQIHVGCQMRRSEVEFYVQDSGMGIDPEDAEKIFLVFRRGKNAAAQNVIGKGVGLASVKSIVQTYNGRIWVESQPGQGSTFRFTIAGQYVPQLARPPDGVQPAAA